MQAVDPQTVRENLLSAGKGNMMKAIQTSYSGYKFRSRLEAKWAVFFDLMGFDWVYEPEGFELGNEMRYLPDFKVTSRDGNPYWYEVKADNVKVDVKVEAFRKALNACGNEEYCEGVYVELLSGDPTFYLSEPGAVCCPRCGLLTKSDYAYESWYGDEYSLGCMPCDFSTPSGGDHPVEKGLFAEYRPHKGALVLTKSAKAQHDAAVWAAANTARAHRFEFGGR